MRYTINTITPPVNYPVEPKEVMTWLKWDPSNISDRVIIEELVATAVRMVEYYTARAIITQTLEWQLIPEVKTIYDAGVPTSGYEELPAVIKVWRPPLQSVTSIKAVELDGTEHTIDAEDYVYDTKATVGRILLQEGAAWDWYPEGSYLITYVAGYGTTVNTVDPRIRHAIRLMTSQLYGTRERGDIQFSPELQSVLDEVMITHRDLE